MVKKNTITGQNQIAIKNIKYNNHLLAQIKADQSYDAVESFTDGVEPFDPNQGTLYFLSGGGKFRTTDNKPELIAAQLEQPRFKNCQFLISLQKGGCKNCTLFKCTKKNGKICSVVKLYNKK